MKREKVKVSKLQENPNNPRLLKKDKQEKLEKSIKEFPEMLEARPIVVNKDYTILGGNMRYKALIASGSKEADVLVVDWSEDKQREFIIKDNVGFGEWDWDDLATWDQEELIDWGMDLPDDWQVEEELEAEEDNYEEPENIKVDVVLGDLIEIGEHRLLCGDSTDSDQVAKLINNSVVNLITDPPYGINANKQTLGTGKKDFHRGDDWDKEVLDFYYILSLVDKAIIWGGNYFADKLKINNDWLCWHKKTMA